MLRWLELLEKKDAFEITSHAQIHFLGMKHLFRLGLM